MEFTCILLTPILDHFARPPHETFPATRVFFFFSFFFLLPHSARPSQALPRPLHSLSIPTSNSWSFPCTALLQILFIPYFSSILSFINVSFLPHSPPLLQLHHSHTRPSQIPCCFHTRLSQPPTRLPHHPTGTSATEMVPHTKGFTEILLPTNEMVPWTCNATWKKTYPRVIKNMRAKKLTRESAEYIMRRISVKFQVWNIQVYIFLSCYVRKCTHNLVAALLHLFHEIFTLVRDAWIYYISVFPCIFIFLTPCPLYFISFVLFCFSYWKL